MLADVVSSLRCPHCDTAADVPVALTDDGRVLRCAAGHTFDVARQGYVSLLTGQAPAVPGDTAAMVAARESFLGGGHFAPIAQAVAARAAATTAPGPAAAGPSAGGPSAGGPGVGGPGVGGPGAGLGGREGLGLLDLGAGTGYYLAAALEAVPGAVGIAADISGYALRRAARAHPRIGAVRCDAWRPLPVRTGAVDVVLNVFAPRNGGELSRVLRPGGVVLTVAPTDRHLRELASAVGAVSVDPRKSDRVDAALGPYLTAAGSETIETTVRLDHAAAVTAVAMGPSAWHVEPDELAARIGALPAPIEVTVSVTLSVYERAV
ncbi:putative RNA methyltransferase [Cryptosporangium phraense]|uniref:Methyltransferase domain-containing protein n=1 Tax=Cryptosporangium phraense TaxID=2593070 RepID=A0A545B1L2_9ACTN|nr:methyltransferase domain-containing protein [Cryptosporangium phraense]TQS46735.1 methyltransferase domain-containing protein [Cryptosporangium phraense]